MRHKALYGNLARDLSAILHERGSGKDVQAAHKLSPMPLNNFFGDELFALLYSSKEPCPRGLCEVKANLVTVSDPETLPHERAKAALNLGNFIASRYVKEGSFILGVSPPIHWFRLSRRLGNVEGALAYANALLQEEDLQVKFDQKIDRSPGLLTMSGAKPSRCPSNRVCLAWRSGARIAMDNAQREFPGWSQKTFDCALACVINYLTLLPEQQGSSATEERCEPWPGSNLSGLA